MHLSEDFKQGFKRIFFEDQKTALFYYTLAVYGAFLLIWSLS